MEITPREKSSGEQNSCSRSAVAISSGERRRRRRTFLKRGSLSETTLDRHVPPGYHPVQVISWTTAPYTLTLHQCNERLGALFGYFSWLDTYVSLVCGSMNMVKRHMLIISCFQVLTCLIWFLVLIRHLLFECCVIKWGSSKNHVFKWSWTVCANVSTESKVVCDLKNAHFHYEQRDSNELQKLWGKCSICKFCKSSRTSMCLVPLGEVTIKDPFTLDNCAPRV